MCSQLGSKANVDNIMAERWRIQRRALLYVRILCVCTVLYLNSELCLRQNLRLQRAISKVRKAVPRLRKILTVMKCSSVVRVRNEMLRRTHTFLQHYLVHVPT